MSVTTSGAGRGRPLSGGADLDLKGKVVQKAWKEYDQVQDETTNSTQKSTRQGGQESNGESVKESVAVTKRNATEKANIGYSISFSIPFIGTVPTGLSGTTNC